MAGMKLVPDAGGQTVNKFEKRGLASLLRLIGPLTAESGRHGNRATSARQHQGPAWQH